jgi:hypothetical protein
MAIIGDYWDQKMVKKVVNLMKEYEELFPRILLQINGVVKSIFEMKIQLKPNVKLVKWRPYHLKPKCKEKVCK